MELAETLVKLGEGITNIGVGNIILALFIILFASFFSVILDSVKKSVSKTLGGEGGIEELSQRVCELQAQIQQIKSESDEKSFAHGPDIMELYMKMNKSLKPLCRTIVSELKAIRTSIYLFHNGTTSSHGLPFFKVSCISEIIEETTGIGSMMREQINIPVNIFDTMIDDLYSNGVFIVEKNRIGACEEILVTRFLLNRRNNTCICTSIRDDNSRLIGFALTEFSRDMLEDDREYVLKRLHAISIHFGPILQFSEYVNVKYDQSNKEE